ncbi:hypothetical protein BE61_p0240 (plasmid) [Bradyrhizobium elkanii USDA 61]|nr:hypothetical protein BE61_p0240 [Bradyrhizobium elkanii USDA 61]
MALAEKKGDASVRRASRSYRAQQPERRYLIEFGRRERNRHRIQDRVHLDQGEPKLICRDFAWDKPLLSNKTA